jgi:hypothetical protein
LTWHFIFFTIPIVPAVKGSPSLPFQAGLSVSILLVLSLKRHQNVNPGLTPGACHFYATFTWHPTLFFKDFLRWPTLQRKNMDKQRNSGTPFAHLNRRAHGWFAIFDCSLGLLENPIC